MPTGTAVGLGIRSETTILVDQPASQKNHLAAIAESSSTTATSHPSVTMATPGLNLPGGATLDGITPTLSTQTSTAHVVPPSAATMAQLSFGPATQQTVTTVTTTTTVSLPPLIMKPPKDLYERDLKNYPLAFSPTPQSLKRFAFDINGKPASFIEAEDAAETMRRYHHLQARLEKSHGTIGQEGAHLWHIDLSDETTDIRRNKTLQGIRSSHAPKRTATPPSIADAAELASLQRKSKKPRSHLHRTESEQMEFPSINQRTAAGAFGPMAGPAPITPDTEIAAPMLPAIPGASYSRRRRSPERLAQFRLQQLQDTDDGEGDDDTHVERTAEDLEEETSLGPPFLGRPSKKQRLLGQTSASGACLTPGSSSNTTLFDNGFQVPARRSFDHQRPNLPTILTGSQQDVSLPSPSLSPITAAANLMTRNHSAFDTAFAEHDENGSTTSVTESDKDNRAPSGVSTANSQAKSKLEDFSQHSTSSYTAPSVGAAQGPTVMDLPTMVDAFDSMPEAMQTYLIYQFLRRCTKPTLQVVANVVNPALKCDPFNVLPLELSLGITRFLDARSMCRAAQVSKKWRKLINSDERAWKDLLDRDEFVLPKDEIARAVREGWGWQHPGEDGFEQDLSKQILQQSSDQRWACDGVGSVSDQDEDEGVSPFLASKSKRRSAARMISTRKSKRRTGQASSVSHLQMDPALTKLNPWRHLLASAQGPMAFATAAAQAVPYPTVGLPSLRNMHLFKSLYKRHYLIRKAWMQEESHSQPMHLAFRAHHRHVVTCLLFDSDKILTGSDDTKINVYDTKTGALRKRLEGHEGGVWALQYEGDTLVSGSTDRSVRVWDIKSGRCLQVFQGHTSTVRCLVILQPVQVGTEQDGTPIMMPEEPLIITGSRDSTLRVWKLPRPGDPSIFQAGPPQNDRDNPYFLRTLSGHHNSVRAIAAHGDTLVSGSYDCSVRVWKISTGDLIHRLQGHTQKVYSVVLDVARNRCISGSMDTLVKVWDLQTGTCLFNLEGHTSLVGLLDLSHDRLVSAAADSTLRIWDPENGACKATLTAHTGAITCFQHDGQKVISGSDRTLKMWNVKNGECVRDLLTDLSGVWQVRFDQRRCVAAVQRNAMTYIEVLDFGAARDGVPLEQRGRRVVVDCRGREIEDVELSGPIVDPEGDVGSEP